MKSYLGSPVQVLEDFPDGTSAISAVEIVSTGDLYDWLHPTQATPAVEEPATVEEAAPVDAVGGEPQPAEAPGA